MREKSLLTGINRRDFLRIAGLATGATVTLPLQAYARFLFDGRPPLKVGIIVPGASIQSDIGKKLVDGMKLQFAEAGWETTRLLVRESGNGTEINTALRLLMEDGVEILTGMFNPLTVHRLRDALERTGTLFINIEGGANAFVPRENSPLMYQNSLGYWQSNWAMGNWAARNMGHRAALVSSFYETGYDSYYAFPQGFEAAGGTIIRSEVTHAQPGKPDLGTTMASIAASRPDFVFVASSGQDALEIVAAYHAAGLTGKIPLVGSGFMVQEAQLARMGSAARGITSCLPWAPTLDTPDNRAFCSAFLRATGGQPDSFAVLGYDTGTMIVRAVAAAAGKVQRNQDLKKALEGLQISSPRGTFGISTATGSAAAPLYICKVRLDGTALRNTVISRTLSLDAVEKSADHTTLTAKSGWTSSYLSA